MKTVWIIRGTALGPSAGCGTHEDFALPFASESSAFLKAAEMIQSEGESIARMFAEPSAYEDLEGWEDFCEASERFKRATRKSADRGIAAADLIECYAALEMDVREYDIEIVCERVR